MSLERIDFSMTHEDVHVDAPLSNVAMEYRPQGLIAQMICPVVEVRKRSDMYYVFNRGSAFKAADNTRRAPGAPPRIVQPEISSDTYYCLGYGLRTLWPPEEEHNADFTSFRTARTRFLVDQLLLDYESRVAGIVTSTGNMGSATNCASDWDDKINAAPFDDVKSLIDGLEEQCGYPANVIYMGRGAWAAFRKSQNVTGTLNLKSQYGGAKLVTPKAVEAELSEYVGVPVRLLVGRAMVDSAGEGATQFLRPVWDSFTVVAANVPETADLAAPAWIKAFRWSVPELPSMLATTPRYDEKEYHYWMDVGYYQVEKVVDTSMSRGLLQVNSSQ